MNSGNHLLTVQVIRLFTITCSFLFSTFLKAGWYDWTLAPTAYSGNITTVSSNEDGSIYVAGLGMNGVNFSSDQGQNWDFRPLSSGISDLQFLYYSVGIAGDVMRGHNTTQRFTTSEGWEVGSSPSIANFYPPGIYTSASWLSFTSFCFAAAGGSIYYQPPAIVLPQLIPATPAISSNVNEMFCTDSICWIVSQAGDIYKFKQSDLTCVRVFDGTNPLNGVHFLNELLGYAVGDGGIILKTTDGGLTWSTESSPSSANLNAVFFDKKNRGVIVGDNGTAISTLDLQHWTAETIPVTFHLYDVTLMNDSLAALVGASGTVLIGNLMGLEDDHTIYDKRANSWFFGEGSGFTFLPGDQTTVPPTTLVSSSTSGASVCDTAGNLRYYTDGRHIWDDSNMLVPGSTGLVGGSECNSNFRTLMVDHPAIPKKSFLFYVARAVFPLYQDTIIGFYYSVVNDTLNGGNPGMEIINELIFDDPAVMITAVNHANNRDVWIIVHDAFSFKFYAYLLTCDGLNKNPVISEVGEYGPTFSAFGNILASPRGDLLAMNAHTSDDSFLQQFDFNAATGILSNGTILDQSAMYNLDPLFIHFSTSFSSDGSELIVHTEGTAPNAYLDQYHLYPSTELLPAEQDSIFTYFGNYLKSPQLGPDGRIYFISQDKLSVINNPNQDIEFVEYIYQSSPDLNGTSYGVLPRFNQSIFYKSGIHNSEVDCGLQAIHFELARLNYPVAPDSLQWNFDDSASGAANYSNLIEPEHFFESKGWHEVKCIRYYNNGYADTLLKPIYIPDVSFSLPDTTMLIDDIALLQPTLNYSSSFLWSTGEKNSAITVSDTGWYSLILDDCYCGSYIDSIYVTDTSSINMTQDFATIPNIFTPNGDGINDLYFITPQANVEPDWLFIIVDRWGNVMKYMNEEFPEWDGTTQDGFKCTDGVYFYIFHAKIDSKTVKKTGSITLSR